MRPRRALTAPHLRREVPQTRPWTTQRPLPLAREGAVPSPGHGLQAPGGPAPAAQACFISCTSFASEAFASPKSIEVFSA